jgi:hypothetical protein
MLCNNYQYRYFLKCCSKVPFITSIIIIMIINKNSQVTLCFVFPICIGYFGIGYFGIGYFSPVCLCN